MRFLAGVHGVRQKHSGRAQRASASGRALLDGKVVHIADVEADPEYTFADAGKLGGYRTALGVPMLRGDVPIGVMSLTRSDVRPFTDRQIQPCRPSPTRR